MTTQTPITEPGSGHGRARRTLLALLVVGVALLALPAVSQASYSLQWNDGSTAAKTFDFGTVAFGSNSTQVLAVRCKSNSILDTGSNCQANKTYTLNPSNVFSTANPPVPCDTTGNASFNGNSSACNTTVRFTPAHLFGTYSGTVTIGGSRGTMTATLNGRAVRVAAADVSFLTSATSTTQQTSDSMGAVAQTQPLTKTYTLYNTGNAAVTGINNTSSSSFTGTNASDFSILPGGNTCPASLAIGASCTISVTATPSNIGNESATLTTSGTPSTSLALTVTGAPPVYSAELRDTAGTAIRPTQDFGTVTAPANPSYAYTLINTGNVPMTGANLISITGTPPADAAFSQTNNCPATLNPQVTCTITVTVNDQTFGDSTAQLNVAATNVTIAPSTLHANLQGVAGISNDVATDTGGKRWLDTATIGDASTTGIAAATPNNEVRVSLDLPHSTSFRPSNLQVSSSSGSTAPGQSDPSWQDVSSAQLRQLPGSNNRTQINAAFNAATFGWSGNTSPGVGATRTNAIAGLAGAGNVALPQGYCNSLGTGTTSSGKLWLRVRDSNFSYSLPFSTSLSAARTTWSISNPTDFLVGTTNISSLGLGWFTGDCVAQPPAVTDRAITQVGATPYAFSDGKQEAETTAGTPVTFTFAGHGGTYYANKNYGFQLLCLCTPAGTGTNAAAFTGIQWRARNTVTGQVINGGTSNFSNTADGAQQSITTTFPSRGRWVVEGVPQGNNSTTAAGLYDYIGSVQVNAAPSPSLSLTGVPAGQRLLSNHNYTLTANSSDVDPLGSSDPFGGLVSTVEWDLDNDHTNGPGDDGYETRIQASPYKGLAASQLTQSFDTTGKTPGPYQICARVTDNGAYNGGDSAAHTTETCVDVTINSPPVADDKTVDIEADDGQPVNVPLTATDADDDPLDITVADQTHSGTVGQGAGNSADYTWPTSFAGTDQFTFVAHDDHNATGTAR